MGKDRFETLAFETKTAFRYSALSSVSIVDLSSVIEGTEVEVQSNGRLK